MGPQLRGQAELPVLLPVPAIPQPAYGLRVLPLTDVHTDPQVG